MGKVFTHCGMGGGMSLHRKASPRPSGRRVGHSKKSVNLEWKALALSLN